MAVPALNSHSPASLPASRLGFRRPLEVVAFTERVIADLCLGNEASTLPLSAKARWVYDLLPFFAGLVLRESIPGVVGADLPLR